VRAADSYLPRRGRSDRYGRNAVRRGPYRSHGRDRVGALPTCVTRVAPID